VAGDFRALVDAGGNPVDPRGTMGKHTRRRKPPMNIFDSYHPTRPDRPVRHGAPTRSQREPTTTAVAPVSNADSVKRSEPGRSMSRTLDTEHGDVLDPERTMELRRKVREGAYNALDVVEQMARRIMRGGDL
jgi:hypothetical protein